MRGCVTCGIQKKKSEYSKNQWRKGDGNSKCASCIQQGRNDQPSRERDAGDNGTVVIAWENIADAVSCDAEGCSRTSPTIRCACTAPVYYCSERCKRRHRSVHSEDCRDLEQFRCLTISSREDPNVNSGLCNVHPDTLYQMREYAMATALPGRRTVETLLLQAECIHQADENWEQAFELYQEVLMMGGAHGENLSPPQCRQAFMGIGHCLYEMGRYDEAIDILMASIKMNRHFPHVHTYLALSHLAKGNCDLAIKTMKQAVLYEAPWSDDTVRTNKKLLCGLMSGGVPQGLRSTTSTGASRGSSTAQPRIDVFYGRTDGTIGYKEYSAVVVKTTETEDLHYFDDLYEPRAGCDYEVLFEVDVDNLPMLCRKAGVDKPNIVGWVESPLKEVVLEHWSDRSPEAAKRAVVAAGVSQGILFMPEQGNPTSKDVGNFIPTSDLLQWERSMRISCPQVWTADDPLLGNDAGQHELGTHLVTDIDGDPAQRIRCEVLGSKWQVWNIDGDREPVYVVLVAGGALSQMALSSAHEPHNTRVVGGKGRRNSVRPAAGTRVPREQYPDAADFGWTFTGSAEASRVEFFERNFPQHGLVKLDFYYTTGTVKTVMDHPRQGTTQLFARGDNLSPDTYKAILRNPRHHTGVRYQRCHETGTVGGVSLFGAGGR